ncbi:hypothetical protein M0R45_012312 [Rubus argutus]|uniref:Blue (type 1) copper domain-containing protein n=1 Tax=Rubus argutus TaxID=59490 RepID=A0AAW1YCM0_RUBAR
MTTVTHAAVAIPVVHRTQLARQPPPAQSSPSNAMAAEVLLGGSDGSLAFVPNEFSVQRRREDHLQEQCRLPTPMLCSMRTQFPAVLMPGKISMSEEDLLNAPGETYSVTLTEKGTYSFYCSPHQGAGMSGKVTVN